MRALSTWSIHRVAAAQSRRALTTTAASTGSGNAIRHFADTKGIKVPEEWYNQSPNEILSQSDVLESVKKHDNSLIRALEASWPEHRFDAARFQTAPGYWKSKEIRKLFLGKVADLLGIKRMRDWYSVPSAAVAQLGGSSLLKEYFNSLPKALMDTYTDHNWLEWRFSEVPQGFWEQPTNWRRFFLWVAERRGYSGMEDWYSMSIASIKKAGGEPILQHAGTIFQAFVLAFPEFNWQSWRFHHATAVPQQTKSMLHRDFFDWVAKELKLPNMEAWYDVTAAQVIDKGGEGILTNSYNYSLVKALQDVYPEHHWLPWRFNRLPRGWWKVPENQRLFFDWVAEQLHIKQKEDWYSQSAASVSALGGETPINNMFHNNLYIALKAVYPEHEWIEWKFTQVSKTFWKSPANQRAFLDACKASLGVKEMTDWYQINAPDLVALGGATGLRYFKGSIIELLKSAYPEHEWIPWKFPRIGPHFWKVVENRRIFLDWVLKHEGKSSLDDWYEIKPQTVRELGGATLLGMYSDSLIKTLMALYPDHKWVPHQFVQAPGGHWAVLENRKACLEAVAKQLGIQRLSDWYKFGTPDLKSSDASSFISHFYGNSLYRCLCDIYPHYKWKPWLFQQVPQRFWADQAQRPDPTLLREYIEHVASTLGLRDPEDWYRISDKQLGQIGLVHVIKHFGGFCELLQIAYPEREWQKKKFQLSAKKSTQMVLSQRLKEIFPDFEMEEEYKLSNFELDFFIPKLGLAFELQGEQHYQDFRAVESLDKNMQIDEAKAAACMKAGISLVLVPYFWDGTAEQLREMITEIRPDVTGSKL